MEHSPCMDKTNTNPLVLPLQVSHAPLKQSCPFKKNSLLEDNTGLYIVVYFGASGL